MSGPSSSSLSSQSDEEIEDGSQPSVEGGPQPQLKKSEVLTPLGKSKQGMLWKKVEVNNNMVNVKGGLCATYHSAASIMYTMGKSP